MTGLLVEFIGEERQLDIDDELTFGRKADLDIDTNPYLHRRLGLFSYHSGAWWIHNVGTAISLEVCDLDSPSRLSIAPGVQAPLPFSRTIIRFTAGASTYDLNTVGAAAGELNGAGRVAREETTITASQVSLNQEQRILLGALSQNRLRHPTGSQADIPASPEIADSLSWTITKFNRKLDNLCDKFVRLGVAGLKGDLGALTPNRRERLVDRAITVGRVNPSDLELLERG